MASSNLIQAGDDHVTRFCVLEDSFLGSNIVNL